jgi:DNA polymerase-1
MSPKHKTLYLIDGANFVFRAYYAIRGLSNSKGFPTNALYGFANMLLKLLREENPDYIAVCFDTKEPTFRDKMYAEYKANRKEPPEDLVQQFPYVIPMVEALGLPVVEKPGFEADDLIGTLATRFASDDLHVVIASGDKDLMQLVGDHVTILDEMKGLRIGRDEVREKFGVGPEGVVEVLSLMGDSSDNIPGVPGVGPKTAKKLIAEYGSLEAVLENAERVPGKVGERLKEGAELARLSMRLVTIDKNVSLKFDLKNFERRAPGGEKLAELFKELEFTKLLESLVPQKGLSYQDYRLVQDEAGLKSVVKDIKNKKIVSFDLETTSLDTMIAAIVGISLSWSAGEAAYIPLGHVEGGGKGTGSNIDLFAAAHDKPVSGQMNRELAYTILRPLLADPAVKKIGQNLNYDLSILRRLGFEVNGVEFDTMLASYVLDPAEGHGLDAMARQYLDHSTIKYEDVTGKGKEKISFAEVALDKACEYACEDADVAFRLAGLFRQRLEEEGLQALFHEIEMPVLDVLVDMELAGVKIDADKLRAQGVEFEKELATLESEIHRLAGREFNIGSPKQLGEILFEGLKLPGGKRTKTGFSTNQSVLEELATDHELPNLVLRWRSLGKLKSTYIDALPAMIDPHTGRVHTTFNQAQTATGRLSSSDPNLQNIPIRTEEGRRIREAFVAEEGFSLISADYSQIELRVLAGMSGEGALIEAFGRGEDVHALTASGIFGVKPPEVTREQRAVGKTVNFATIYGQTSYGLSKQLGIPPGEAQDYIDNYFLKYPRVAEYRVEILEGARRTGRVTTLFGRRRFFTDIESTNGQLRQLAERMAFNTVFQGTAADIIKRAMIEVHAHLGSVSKEARLLLQVHDELIIEAPDADVQAVSAFVVEKMSRAAKLSVPLVVDVGAAKNWAEAH